MQSKLNSIVAWQIVGSNSLQYNHHIVIHCCSKQSRPANIIFSSNSCILKCKMYFFLYIYINFFLGGGWGWKVGILQYYLYKCLRTKACVCRTKACVCRTRACGFRTRWSILHKLKVNKVIVLTTSYLVSITTANIMYIHLISKFWTLKSTSELQTGCTSPIGKTKPLMPIQVQNVLQL